MILATALERLRDKAEGFDAIFGPRCILICFHHIVGNFSSKIRRQQGYIQNCFLYLLQRRQCELFRQKVENRVKAFRLEESARIMASDDAIDAKWFDVFYEQRENGNYALRLVGDCSLSCPFASFRPPHF